MEETKKLVELITKGIQDKKGHGIVIADLSEIMVLSVAIS